MRNEKTLHIADIEQSGFFPQVLCTSLRFMQIRRKNEQGLGRGRENGGSRGSRLHRSSLDFSHISLSSRAQKNEEKKIYCSQSTMQENLNSWNKQFKFWKILVKYPKSFRLLLTNQNDTSTPRVVTSTYHHKYTSCYLATAY